MLVETILAALVPVGVEGVKQLIMKFTGGVKATTVAEQIQLDQSEVGKMQALAALDNPYGVPSQWVIDLRASSRYLGALAVITVGLSVLYIPGMPKEVVTISMEAVSIVFGFLFGSRILVSHK